MPQRLFITGATGKTGRSLLALLRSDPEYCDARITCLVRPASPCESLLPFRVRIAGGDASNPKSLTRVYGGEETVIHLSSIFHTSAVLEACKGMKRLLAISSTRIFSKSWHRAQEIEAAELEIARSGVPFTILRPTMIYGTEDDRNVARLVRLIKRWPIIPLPGGGKTIFQPVHVEDLAICILAALKIPASIGKTYNIPGGSACTLEEMVELIADALGKKVEKLPIPHFLAELWGGISRIFGPHLARSAEEIRRLRENRAFDFSDAARDLNYSPRTFKEGLLQEIRTIYRQESEH